MSCSTVPSRDETILPRWSGGVALCPVCWHPLTAPLQAEALASVARRLGSLIGVGHGHLADDWDDSHEGSIALAKVLEDRLPLRRLQTADRRKAVFQIAQTQHRVIALDAAPSVPAFGNLPAGPGFAVRQAWAIHLQKLIDQACTDLVKDTIK